MLAPFLIMLREGIEAALLVGIIATYLRQTGRAAWIPTIWVGILLAIALSFLTGAIVLLLGGEFPQKQQEFFEAIIGLLAVGILTWMVFWMRRASRSIKAGLQADIDRAFEKNSGGTWALIGMAFFAVAREGLESVFFLLAIFQQSPGPAAPLSALAGIALSVAIGLGIYYGGVRIDLRRFFHWTGLFILVVATGLLSSVLRNLHEAGIWNILQERAYDFTEILPLSSLPGTMLSGLFGYHDAPAMGEVLIWALYLGVTLTLFFRPQAARTPQSAPAAGK
ncbi:MAG: iron transporter [Pelagibacterium sp. SCN 64-44]|nr:MAG: iron transporter [Pelagibacterium sp. SCN 64-44]